MDCRHIFLVGMVGGWPVLSCDNDDKTGSDTYESIVSEHGDGGGADGGRDTGDSEGDGSCDVAFGLVNPSADGAVDVYHRDTIVIAMTQPDPTAALSLVDASGATIGGSNTFHAETGQFDAETGQFDAETYQLLFQPTAPLGLNADHVATVDFCGGQWSFGFRTGSLGESLEDGPGDLVGRTYVLDLGAGTFIRPPGVGALMGDRISQNILMGVVRADETTLELIGALSVEGGVEQDFCAASIVFPTGADFTAAPYFSIGPVDARLQVGGYEVTMEQMQVSGTFVSDGSEFAGASLSGQLDVRDMVAILGELSGGETADDLCDLIAGLAGECEACASDGNVYCIGVEVVDLRAPENPGQVLDLLDECDPARCASGCNK